MRAEISTHDRFWRRSHHLNRMTMRELVAAYFQHPAIIAYLALAGIFIALAIAVPATTGQVIASIVIASLVYPFAWYVIHRCILHGSWMWKNPQTAKVWKRTHYDHHQDPNHLEVLFGALVTTLPTVAVATALAGYLIGGIGGMAAAFATGLITTCAYEFVHCIQHLGFKPKSRWLAELKRRHMEHHFHDETGNYGIMSFVPDKLFGTMYDRAERPKRSPHVFNLGYTAAEAERWPWVAELSGGVVSDSYTPRQPAASPVPIVPAE
jgi:sterol desaturase/sphingolipid hydroxylase (fatty acid hydroxylase superfamily)